MNDPYITTIILEAIGVKALAGDADEVRELLGLDSTPTESQLIDIAEQHGGFYRLEK